MTLDPMECGDGVSRRHRRFASGATETLANRPKRFAAIEAWLWAYDRWWKPWRSASEQMWVLDTCDFYASRVHREAVTDVRGWTLGIEIGAHTKSKLEQY